MATNRGQLSRVMLQIERELLSQAHLRELLTTANIPNDRYRKEGRVKSRIKRARPGRRAMSPSRGTR